ncbi:hypothetical protein C8R46DRAFT_622631 [Mycena filopes]|nr:hypothetical protein C8R46DRAFT_622631 [Mycena filopes]
MRKLYHGKRARYFYFQCLQLILRHQLAVLVERWALPVELEVVCRDLWALNLSLLHDPPSPEPYLEAEDVDSDAKDQDEQQPPSSDDGDEEMEEAENDPDLDQLLAENSASESSSDNGDDEVNTDVDRETKPTKSGRKRAGLHKYEQPESTLAVIVLACWTLRVPILYRDLTRLIESYDLPYLDATRVLPPSMTVHLNRYNIQALSPIKTPSALRLHTLVSSLAGRIMQRLA